ncbi:response regulator transcription factor [Streptomyces rimosus]|uniref:response regulator transcription factor n=1 Tax=Streptomyces rimosus TaxID=1927 RepID=UPI0004BEFE74|nr:response regulator transcription factor [Streptomyces rimosus]
MTRVLVVEDQRTLAEALELAIGAQPDLECVGTVDTVEQALPLARTGTDVVLMDVHLPGTDGISGTSLLKTAAPALRVLILTGDPRPRLLAAAAAAGAAGFLTKDSALPDILAAIRAPATGPLLVAGGTLAALAGVPGDEPLPPGAGRPASRQRSRARCTARELEVLQLLGEGLGPKAIAERLVISPHTARGHVKSIMHKLNAHSQLETVVRAIREGLLPPTSGGRPGI